MKRLLFVCVENSCRSQIAEAFARIHGGDDIEAHSAGSRPSGEVNARAIESMREIGYDLTKHQSKSLTDIPDIEKVVAEKLVNSNRSSKGIHEVTRSHTK